MASGHECRINRPDTWLHQPASHQSQRKPLPTGSRPHTWHISDEPVSAGKVRFQRWTGQS